MMSKILKMFAVFERKQKKKLIGITFLMLGQALLELLGVSIIIPFIDVITQPEVLIGKPYISKVMDWCQVDIDGLILIICLFIILIYIVKNIFLIYLTNVQYKFSYYGKRDLSNRIMKCYLLQDYEFHVKHNSAELIRDISTDSDMFYATVLNFLQLLSEFVICFFLVCYLLLQDAVITIAVAVSLCIMLLFFMGGYKRELVRLGNQRRHYSYKMTQSMQQGFGGIKEIKIANRESFFLEEFTGANNNFSEACRKNVFLNAIPKPIMEAVCVTGLMLVIAIKILTGGTNLNFISVLAVFAVAAFRLLPSVNKISGFIGNILHNGVVIEGVYEKMRQVKELEQTLTDPMAIREMTFEDKLTVEGLSFQYPGTEHSVLENVTLDIHKNQSVAFIGPSGAGKTTLVDILLGLLPVTKGKITVDGQDITDNLAAWRELVGYIPQNIYMLDDTIRNNISFGLKPSIVKDDLIWEALEEAQLADFVRTLPEGLDTMIGEAGVRLSGGQRQRIGIARALFRKPQVLFLDEATSALDNETEAAVMESIDYLQGKMTIVIIAHRLSTIQNCDVVYEVNHKTVSMEDQRASHDM